MATGKQIRLEMEQEAREAAFYDGHGWAFRTHNGKRTLVACSFRYPGDHRYGMRFGYVVDDGWIMSQDEFDEHSFS